MGGTRTVQGTSPAPSEPLEDLTFHPSPDNSLGIELEFQVLDRESGDLAPGSVRVLDACAEEGIESATAELLQSMLEVKTGVCHNVAEARDTLLPTLRRVHHIASSLGYDLAMGGTHPFSRTSTGAVHPGERYQRVHRRMAWLALQDVIFGLHVHVGMPDGDAALGVTSLLVEYLPHLLALSSNSPFWQGIDTGLASTRAALFRLSPHAGVPYHFTRWNDFKAYCQVMHGSGAIRATKDLYWDIRPRPQQGTLEFRICDMPATLEHALGLAALIRCLTVAALRRLEEKPRMRRGDQRRYWIAVENKWLATRYGLGAQCIRTPGGKPRPLDEDLAALFERMMPLARENGDDEFLSVFQPLDRFETGAERQRGIYRETGDWKSVIQSMRDGWTGELKEASRNV